MGLVDVGDRGLNERKSEMIQDHAVGILFALLIGHALADYPLQGDFIANFKSYKTKLGKETVWPYVLGSHCLIHAGFVWVITGSMMLAVFELAAHFVIDMLKCGGKTNFHIDQWLHVLCKVVWVIILIVVW